ncbi:ArnT family glycosyltransferase [Pseudoalteromonas piratica]|uniref:ArnT-like N-terminal domain-containing protein n=1 Tax=Pseudoalteromonas piratica TaxID=1348114 RepID=A0A0A7EFI9_9GAMM|nr:glycosyltransferase family 39 protein [Pseudoalteromonas piratica]AIY64762.1 hypothetical protein OM33_06090 [Pseudoalteromonas piratica]
MLVSNRLIQLSLLLIAILIGSRLISLGMYPLFDTTEARYAEIARIMFETRDWITPQFDYNIPFWGKPPLHTWFSAISFALFGVNEFSARIPHFLTGIATLITLYYFAKTHFSKLVAIRSTLILTTSLGFIVAIGMVMTDSQLLFSITLAMVSFYHCYFNASKFAGICFFVALAIGMLAKGPVAIILIGIPLTLWSIHHKKLWHALSSLPWLAGSAILLTLTLPWYLLAELKTPGFLDYFLWGEHVQRFLVSGWQGDLYGSAHKETKGTIWLFWLAVAFPWSFIAIWQSGRSLISSQKKRSGNEEHSALIKQYFIYWALSPMLLFTFAGNILPAYVLPSLPALALLLALSKITFRKLVLYALLSATLILTALSYFISGYSSKVSHRDVLQNLTQSQLSQPIYYWHKRPFSAQFYSNGAAQKLTTIKELILLDENGAPFILVSNEKQLFEIAVYAQSQCIQINKTKGFVLYQCGN